MTPIEIQDRMQKFHARMARCGPYPQTGQDVITLTIVELLGECALQLSEMNERERSKLQKKSKALADESYGRTVG